MLRALFCMLLLAWSESPTLQEGLRTRKTKEAIVKSNTNKEIAQAVGQRIDNFCSVLGDFYEELGLEKKSDNKLVARLFNTYEEYEVHYRRAYPQGAPPLAYYSPSLNAIVLYNDEVDVTLRQTLFHESSHQYLDRFTSDAPRWLNEGLAEFFEGWRMSSEGTLLEKRVHLYDLKVLQDALRAGKHLPPHELVSLDDEQFKDFRKHYPELHPYLHYMTSWGLVWFSLELSSDPEDRERLIGYLSDLNEKGPNARFEVEDWEDFETRWSKALLGLQVEPVDAVDFVLLAAGYREGGDYAKAAQLYQSALEKDPRAPGALFGVGLCFKRMGNNDEALKWLEKARQVEPENPSIPYLMARIVLGIDMQDAKGDPARALELAEEASELASGESPQMLELVARCQAAGGDGGAAARTLRKILALVEDEAEKAYYEELAKELR